MSNKNKMSVISRDGFTFIEIILYVGIVTIVAGTLITFAWNAVHGRVKVGTQREVIQNLRYISDRIAFEIKNADAITNITSDSITLDYSSETGRDPTLIALSGTDLEVGVGTSGSCTTSNPCPINSGLVEVTDFMITDLTGTGLDHKNIQFSLTISYKNSSGRQEYDKTETYTTTVTNYNN